MDELMKVPPLSNSATNAVETFMAAKEPSLSLEEAYQLLCATNEYVDIYPKVEAAQRAFSSVYGSVQALKGKRRVF